MKAELLDAFDRMCRRDLEIHDPAYHVETTARVTRILGPSPAAFENAVIYGDLRRGLPEAVIEDELRYFADRGRGFEWKHFAHDAPRGLEHLLETRGFVAGEAETLLVLDVGAMRAAPVVTGAMLRRLERSSELDAITRMQEALYGVRFDWLREGLARELAHAPSSLEIHAAYVDGAPVSTGWIRFHGKFAYLHGGATLEPHRGRGLFRSLVAVREEAARRRGVEHLVCDATEMSRPILERLGFEPLTTTVPYVLDRAE